MIWYNSRSCTSMIQFTGSIFPSAIRWGLPSAIGAAILKHLTNEGIVLPRGWGLAEDAAIYNSFWFALSFVLVFRTSQAYSRYWTAATSVHTMRAEWYDACASLIAYAMVAKRPPGVIKHFIHTSTRLFALMHAMAIEELGDLQDEDFPLLDIQGFSVEDLEMLTEKRVQGRKVELVFQWVKSHIVHGIHENILAIPPPILTRVFQELGVGLVKYHEALQVVIWPFPFAYSQMAFVLSYFQMICAPFVTCAQSSSPFSAFVFALASVTTIKALDLIACELEQPFGEDPNDLPTFEMHCEFIEDLVLLLDPKTWRVPRLMTHAITDFAELAKSTTSKASLQEYNASKKETLSTGSSGSKAVRGVFWKSQDYEINTERIGRVLGMREEGRAAPEEFIASTLLEEKEEDVAVPPANAPVKKVQPHPEWHACLADLSDIFVRSLDQQLSQQMDAYSAQLALLKEALKTMGGQQRPNTTCLDACHSREQQASLHCEPTPLSVTVPLTAEKDGSQIARSKWHWCSVSKAVSDTAPFGCGKQNPLHVTTLDGVHWQPAAPSFSA
eukprot:TRINITY_DN11022_c0_g1_i1.p1 TRINITY_DN11022_c0_g1~~TRINITY_DN11022_c0_g1_i1.p1  ORF type:complete len:557 (+),score=64.26 TRINITY_DN11022_c0_g1_i1:95-1765(+)